MRIWAGHEVETIRTIIHEDAPWRVEEGWGADSGDFVASFLNCVEQLDDAGQLSAENIRAWWRATPEYIERWPIWEEEQKPKPEPLPPDPERPDNAVAGQLRVTSKGYADDGGAVLPVGIHLGDLFSVYTRDPQRAIDAVSAAASAGYGLLQFWLNLGSLGGDYWAGREIGPEITPDYWGQLTRFSDVLDSYGMRGIYCTGDYELRSMSHEDFARQLGQLLAPRDTGALVIAGNEAWQTGADSIDTLQRFCEAFASVCPDVPTTTTAPPTEAAEDIARWCDGDYYAIHGYRGGEDHDRVRHIFSVPWEGHPPTKCGYQDEPTGPGDAVSVKASHCYHGRDVDANHLCALAAMSLMTDQGFNFFCGDGVKLTTVDALRAWPGFIEVPQVAPLLPIDLMSWPKPFHFGDSQSAHRVFRPSSGSHVRCDMRIAHDGRIIGVLYGDESSAVILCERPCRVELIEWDSAVIVGMRDYRKGDDLRVIFERSQGGQPGHTAYLMRGRLA